MVPEFYSSFRNAEGEKHLVHGNGNFWRRRGRPQGPVSDAWRTARGIRHDGAYHHQMCGTGRAYNHYRLFLITNNYVLFRFQTDSGPCTFNIGEIGSGNYVKMVHNGIEYGDMQLICEAYDILKIAGGMSNPELADTFKVFYQYKTYAVWGFEYCFR